MVTINYERDSFKLAVEGHARSGEFGTDLICSAVSILVHTMADVVSSMDRAGYCHDADIQIDRGMARIACTPLPEYTDSVLIAMDAVATGFGILSNHYPEFVDFQTDSI